MAGEIERISNFEKICFEKFEDLNKPEIEKDDMFVKNALHFLSKSECFDTPEGFRVYVSCEVIIRIWEGRSYFGAAINRRKTQETYDICLKIINEESNVFSPSQNFPRIMAKTIKLLDIFSMFLKKLQIRAITMALRCLILAVPLSRKAFVCSRTVTSLLIKFG